MARPRRRRPRRRRAQGGGAAATALGILLIIAVFGALGVGAYAYWRASADAVSLDQATLCPLRDGAPTPEGYAAILIDTSDELPAIQRESAANELAAAVQDVPQGWQLSVYYLQPDASALPAPALRLCNPGSGEALNALTANPRLARAQWEQDFMEPMQAAVAGGVSRGSADFSPLMETVAGIAAGELSTPSSRNAPRRLILLSDMLQHSDLVSHYRGAPDFTQFAASEAAQRLRADLAGVDVTVFYIDRARDARLAWDEHIAFWDRFFDSQGATIQRVRRIPG